MSDPFIYVEDPQDKQQCIENFPNLRYVGKKTGNTVLHLIGMIKNKLSTYRDILSNILINNIVDVNSLNKRHRTCILEAFKISNFTFVLFIINNSKIDLSIRDDLNLDAFDFACYRNQPEIATIILGKVKNFNIESIHGIKDEKEREKLLYFATKDKSIDYSTDVPEFKIYRVDDFIVKESTESGSFGDISIAIEKSTKKEFVVKRFVFNKKYLYLPDSVIRDIVFLRTLNRYGTAVKIYGVMIDDKKNEFYMVIESLNHIIGDRINNTRYFPKNDRQERYLDMIYEVLQCVDANSKAGLIHCDTKTNNMMIDNENRVRYIDYGFSYYYGISPFIEIINKPIHTGEYLPDDGVSKIDTVFKYRSIKTNKVLFEIKKGYTGLNIDISSVAVMMISKIPYFTYKTTYGSHNGILYTNIIRTNHVDELLVSDEKGSMITAGMIDLFGQEITDLLIEMMEIDPRKRPNAKVLLNRDIFKKRKERGEETLVVPENITMINNEYEPYLSIYSMVNSYNTEDQKQYIRSGFVYYDEIYDHWKDETVTLQKSNEATKRIYDHCLSIAKENKVSMDAFYNAVYYMNSLKEEVTHNKILCFILYYSKIYDDSTFYDVEVERLLIMNVDKHAKITFMRNMFNNVKNDPNFYIMKPTMLFTGYIKFILMSVCTDEEKCKSIMSELQKKLYDFIVGPKEETVTIKISDMVKMVYDGIIDRIPFEY